MSSVDKSQSLTAQSVVSQLGLSARTLARYVERGKIRTDRVVIPGVQGPPVLVYCPEDVAALASQRPVQVAPSQPAPAAQFAPAIVGELREPPLFVGIKEASKLSGLSQAWLRRAVKEHGLPHIVDGGAVKVSRRMLEGIATIGVSDTVNAKGPLLLAAAL